MNTPNIYPFEKKWRKFKIRIHLLSTSVFVVLIVSGLWFSYSTDQFWPFVLSAIAAVLIAGGVSNVLEKRYISDIECPECGERALIDIENADRDVIFKCSNCAMLLKPGFKRNFEGLG